MARNTAGIVAYQFKPGQSGNPEGGRIYANRKRAVRNVSHECLSRVAETLFDGTIADLKKLSESPDVTPMEALFIAVVMKAVQGGDAISMNILMDRFLGKAKDPHREVVSADGHAEGSPAARVAAMSREELEKRQQALRNARG